MPTDFGDYAYACTYWRYGHLEADFGADLEELVRSNYAADERGEQSTGGYWRATDDGWEPADDEAGRTMAKIRAEDDAEALHRKCCWHGNSLACTGTRSSLWIGERA